MNNDMIKMLELEGYECIRELESGELAGLYRFLYTTGLCVGLDELGYRTRFCYTDYKSARLALECWDGRGSPPGPWIKEKGCSGERSNPVFRGIPIITTDKGVPPTSRQ